MALQLCGSNGANTGIVKCSASPDLPQAFSIWGGDLTPQEYASAKAIKDALIADSKLSKGDDNKLFILPIHNNLENKKENNTEETFNNGLKVVTREGVPAIRYGFFTSQQQVKQLRKFNNTTQRILIQDIKKKIWGATDADNNFIGKDARIFFEGLFHPGPDKATGVSYVDIAFIDPVQSYDDAVFVQVDFNLHSKVVGLLDVELVEAKPATSNVLHVTGQVDTAQVGNALNVYEDFADGLAVGSLWKAKNGTTGASVTITSVAKNVLGYWDVTIDSAAYTALTAGSPLVVYNVTPDALDTAGVTGIETIQLVHIKP